jgi:HK97 family phage prohead protease
MGEDNQAQQLDALSEQREIRSATFQPLDMADDGSWFEGYAAVFDEEAAFEVPGVGQVAEVVKRGAFRKALAQGDNVPMLYHHLETHPPLATTQGGTLTLAEDNRGLRVKAEIARHYVGDAVRELVKRGDIPGMSWGFIAGRGNSRVERRAGGLLRTLTGFKKILDVSPTWDPTYRGTEAELRSRAFGLSLTPDLAELIGADLSVSSPADEAPDPEAEVEETRSAAQADDEPYRPSLEQRKRRLQLLIHETGENI